MPRSLSATRRDTKALRSLLVAPDVHTRIKQLALNVDLTIIDITDIIIRLGLIHFEQQDNPNDHTTTSSIRSL